MMPETHGPYIMVNPVTSPPVTCSESLPAETSSQTVPILGPEGQQLNVPFPDVVMVHESAKKIIKLKPQQPDRLIQVIEDLDDTPTDETLDETSESQEPHSDTHASNFDTPPPSLHHAPPPHSRSFPYAQPINPLYSVPPP